MVIKSIHIKGTKRGLATLFFLIPVSAHAAVLLSDSNRTQGYSAWTPASRGDMNTIGMGGATLALPSSISSGEANPAGFAMQSSAITAQINSVSIQDQRVQRSDASYGSNQWGLSVSPSPWGLGFAHYTKLTESGRYLSPNTGNEFPAEVSLREYRFVVARGFFENRLSLGVGLSAMKAIRSIDGMDFNEAGFTYRIGALLRTHDRLILGLAFSPQVTVGTTDAGGRTTPNLPGFNQAVVMPMELGLGLGWIPNRHFKLGASLSYIGSTGQTSLLADQRVRTGENPSWVPRVGASYSVADFKNVRALFAMGSYYEVSRLQNEGNRLHATAALEVNPYFVNTGIGFDLATDYQNIMFSIGIDIVRAVRALDLIPAESSPSYAGFFPPLARENDKGLPTGLANGNGGQESLGDVGEIIRDIPKRLEKKKSD